MNESPRWKAFSHGRTRRMRIALRQATEDHRGEQQQAAGEDDRHDVGLVHPQGQVLPCAAENPTPADVLGALRGNAPLALADEHDADHHGRQTGAPARARFPSRSGRGCRPTRARPRASGRSRLAAGAGHAGEDAGHDQQADAVADAVFVDLFAQPHQEDRAGGHRQHDGDLPAEIKWPAVVQEVRVDQVRLPAGSPCRTSFGRGTAAPWRSGCIR